jgi:hypothetical protein
MAKSCCYELVFLDVRHKWVDGTKTTVELVYYDELGRTIVLAYVHTDYTLEEAIENREEYIEMMLDTIKSNII